MIDSKIEIERTRLLFVFYKKAYIAAILLVLVMSPIFSGKVGSIELMLWQCLFVFAALLQVFLAIRFEKAHLESLEEYRRWNIFAFVGTLSVSCILSYSIVFAAQLSLTEGTLVRLLLLMSITIFSACGFSKLFLAFAIPILVMLGVRSLNPFYTYWFFSILSFVALFIFAGMSRYYDSTLVNSIKIRFEKQELLDELEIKRKEAEQANRAKSMFLASASHDLRQPLHSLGLYLGSLRESLTSDEQRSLGEKVGLSVDALNSLFDSLLDISKLDAGVTKPVIESFQLSDVVARLIDNFKSSAENKGLKFLVDAEPSIVRTDTVLLERVLSNLLSNAVRYTNDGEISLRSYQEGEKVIIEIVDTGVGIPSNEIDKIFTEFYQMDNPERDRSKGLGLGLFIVRRLTDLLGCDLAVESREGSGTRFKLMLDKGDSETVSTSASEIDLTLNIVGTKVLVIDDDREVCSAMVSVLNRWKCDTNAFLTIEEALQSLHDGFVPDIIISDYRLRDRLTGLEAIQILGNNLQSFVPAILITGDTSADRLLEVTKSGCELLHKPVNPGLLKKTIAFVLSENATDAATSQMLNNQAMKSTR